MDPRSSLDRTRKTWRPPRDLEYSRPREIQLTWLGRILVGVAFALVLAGIAAGFALYDNIYRNREQRGSILESGMDTEAYVTRRWTSGRDPVRYWVEYAYGVEGRTYEGRLSIGRKSWRSMQENGTLSVRYLRADPRIHFVRGFEAKLLPSWLPIPVAGSLFFIAWLLSKILSRQRRLLSEGRPAPAIVTKIARTQNGKIAHYVFVEIGGGLVDGKSSPQKSPPAVGSIIDVIYEPDRERNNAIYPLSLVKIRVYQI